MRYNEGDLIIRRGYNSVRRRWIHKPDTIVIYVKSGFYNAGLAAFSIHPKFSSYHTLHDINGMNNRIYYNRYDYRKFKSRMGRNPFVVGDIIIPYNNIDGIPEETKCIVLNVFRRDRLKRNITVSPIDDPTNIVDTSSDYFVRELLNPDDKLNIYEAFQ